MFYNKSTVTKRKNIIKKIEANISASSARVSIMSIPAPEGLSYLPFQNAGIQFGINNPGVLIADEPGLGKTIQAIGIINKDPAMRKILVVCPAGLKMNWKREMQKWLTRQLSIEIAETAYSFKKDIVIINYDQLETYFRETHSIQWDMIIADECHAIKNPKTKRTQAFIGTPDGKLQPIKATRRVFLTGTPILNRANEIWTLISYLNPKIWHSYEDFAEKFCKKDKKDTGAQDSGSSNLAKLQKLLRATVMIRRLKLDVLKDLKPKSREIVKLACSSPELQELVRQENEIWNKMENEADHAKNVAKKAHSSKQWQKYQSTVDGFYEAKKYCLAEISKIRHKTAKLKCPAVISYAQQTLHTNNGKIVIFAHHQDVITEIANAFPGQCVVITGNQSTHAKQKAVDAFQNDPKIRVAVASILVSVGYTITAANFAIFAELDWVPGNITQAEDRIHRIGQKLNVYIKHLIVNGSIDVKMARKVILKQDICEQALNRIAKSPHHCGLLPHKSS